jgi:hypothetical protein
MPSFDIESLDIESFAMLSFDIESFDIVSFFMSSAYAAGARGAMTRPPAISAVTKMLVFIDFLQRIDVAHERYHEPATRPHQVSVG